jgi:hypothetical protein
VKVGYVGLDAALTASPNHRDRTGPLSSHHPAASTSSEDMPRPDMTYAGAIAGS